MQINIPDVKREVEAAFAAYETALVTNDVETLDRLFHDGPHTIRYGVGENLHGYDEIKAFRAARPSVGLERFLEETHITTYGEDMATANTLYRRPSIPGKLGRQSQVWVRMPEGWRVVSAHVSMIDDL